MSEATVFCNQCGQAVNAAASFCTRCGGTLSPATAATPSFPIPPPVAAAYAGFWIRFLAVFIDALIIFAVMLPIRLVLHLPGMFMARHDSGVNPLMMLSLIGFSILINVIATWLYEAFMMSSERQGTLGKMALGLRVTDTSGRRISFGQATLRHFAKWLSSLTLLVGYIMAAFTERKQALHDMIAGTLVLRG